MNIAPTKEQISVLKNILLDALLGSKVPSTILDELDVLEDEINLLIKQATKKEKQNEH